MTFDEAKEHLNSIPLDERSREAINVILNEPAETAKRIATASIEHFSKSFLEAFDKMSITQKRMPWNKP